MRRGLLPLIALLCLSPAWAGPVVRPLVEGLEPFPPSEIPSAACSLHRASEDGKSREFFCSATLVGPLHVATAAHCLEPIRERGGSFHVTCANGTVTREGRNARGTGSHWVHPEYIEGMEEYANEIGDSLLLEVTEAFPRSVRPLRIPRDQDHFERLLLADTECFVAGYGSDADVAEFRLRGYRFRKRVPDLASGRIVGIGFGHEGFLIEAGDSGGTVACKDGSEWVLLGINATDNGEDSSSRFLEDEPTSLASVVDGYVIGEFGKRLRKR